MIFLQVQVVDEGVLVGDNDAHHDPILFPFLVSLNDFLELDLIFIHLVLLKFDFLLMLFDFNFQPSPLIALEFQYTMIFLNFYFASSPLGCFQVLVSNS
jgi:hypothetical protein